MPLLEPQEYVRAREAYSYEARDCRFSIMQTGSGSLSCAGKYEGIFAARVRSRNGLNLRQFELVTQEVFRDCSSAMQGGTFMSSHLSNLQQTAMAIVCWKMSSQGGRGRVENMLDQWRSDTAYQVIDAYENRDVSQFRIGGVGIAIATAFMRFLFPSDFGIMDSRVVGNHTQPNKITTLAIRRSDGYIVDSGPNARKYNEEYTPFLRREASWLNSQGKTFQDVDALGQPFASPFRACDIEMALFERSKGPSCPRG